MLFKRYFVLKDLRKFLGLSRAHLTLALGELKLMARFRVGGSSPPEGICLVGLNLLLGEC